MWKSSELSRARQLLEGYINSEKQAEDETKAQAAVSGFRESIRQLEIYAGVTEKYSKTMLLRVMAFAGIAILLAVFLQKLIFLVAIPIHIVIEISKLKSLGFKRAENFERDYTALLLSLASAVRTGLDPLAALVKAQDLFSEKSVVRTELKAVAHSLEKGATEDHAIRQFAISINHPDIQLFRTAFILARKEGSSLSECLHRLVKVTRQRQSFRRKIRSAVAMQKFSAIGIAVCAIIIGIIQATMNVNAVINAFNHPTGGKLLSLAIVLIVLGLIWMFRLAKNRI